MKIKWAAIPKFELLEADGNWNKFRCVREGIVKIDDMVIHFPIGWITDFTSSPSWARGFVSQLGPHSPAALIHDRLLELGYGRRFARMVMKEQLHLLKKVKFWRKWWMYLGVAFYDMFKPD